MWITTLLSIVYVFACFLVILLILVQKGKGSMGIGVMGGGSQTLFGGSGGQNIFQKATWIFGAGVLVGSLGLSLLKVHESRHQAPVVQAPARV
jgi:preprotein translocase subunit SecG